MSVTFNVLRQSSRPYPHAPSRSRDFQCFWACNFKLSANPRFLRQLWTLLSPRTILIPRFSASWGIFPHYSANFSAISTNFCDFARNFHRSHLQFFRDISMISPQVPGGQLNVVILFLCLKTGKQSNLVKNMMKKIVLHLTSDTV